MRLDRKILFGASILVALMSLNAIVTFRNVWRLDENARWVVHTLQVSDALQELLGSLCDAETGQRGYLLTGDRNFLVPFNDALATCYDKLVRVETLTADNSRQSQRLARLREAIGERIKIMAFTIDLFEVGEEDAARDVVRAGNGRRLMDDIRAQIAEMDAEERDLLERRQEARAQAYVTAIASGVVSFATGLLALGIVVWLGVRYVRDRSRAEASRQHREFLQATVTSLGDGVIVTDLDGRVTLLNQVAENLTGWSQGDAAGRPLDEVFRIVNIDTREPAPNPALQALARQTVVLLADNTGLIARDGTEWPIDDSAAPIRDGTGAVTGAVLVFREISERHRTQRALAEASRKREELLAQVGESEAKFRNLVEGLSEGVYLLDIETKAVLEANPAAARLLGYSPEEMTQLTLYDLVVADRASVDANCQRILEAGRYHVGRRQYRCKDGSLAELELSGSVISQRGRRVFSVVMHDIAEQLRAENAIRASEAKFRKTVDRLAEGVFVVDVATRRFVEANEAALRLLGYSSQEFMALEPFDIVYGESKDEFVHNVQQMDAALQRDGACDLGRKRLRCKNGSAVAVDIRVSVVASGGAGLHAVVVRDVSADEAAQVALRESEERFRTIVDRLSEGVLLVDPETKVVLQANGTFLHLVGATAEQALGKTLYDFACQDRSAVDAEVGLAVQHGQYKLGRRQVRRMDGGTVEVEVSSSHVTTGNRKTLAVVLRDMTEQRAYEDQLFSYQLSLEDANARLKALAITDGLTGVRNRAAFDSKLTEECDRATRYGHPLSVILMDVDHFKMFNDSFGHPAGDEVLKKVAAMLQKTARTTDVVARYGGEEFVVILPDTDAGGAMVLAERCRRAVAATPWDKRGVTISVGVATLNRGVENEADLVKRADEALYRSKQLGRNRVSHFAAESAGQALQTSVQ